MKKLWKRIFPPRVETVLKVQLVSSSTLTLEQWRKDLALVTAAKRLEQDGTYQLALAVLQNSHPRHIVFAPMGVNPNDRIVHQAKIEGYELCLNNLAALSTPFKISKPLEATFQPAK